MSEKEEESLQGTSELVRRDFAIEAAGQEGSISEEQLFDLLADRIAYMIEYELEHLFSLMYRLDIDERKVEAALRPDAPVPANIGLARLVLDRQKQRARTKQEYKPDNLGKDWEW